MADYISTLTGVQMDAALLDMAEHNSEAYAVGERNGIAVDSGDVTYHNNARYYAQQAQSIAPASVTEAVRWDVAQTALTDANKALARSNIDAGKNGAWSNPNLLDNPFFTINQRAQASYTGAVFGVDRWTMTGASGSVVVNSGYLTISNAAGAPYLQRLGRELKLGKTYTASILLNDGTVNSVTFATSTQKEYVYQLGNYYFELDARSAYAPNYRFMVYGNSTWTMDIVAAKLELGTVSTLANDVPPNYVEELHKCEGYFKYLGDIRWTGYGMALNNSQIRLYIPFPKMAKTPTSGIITTPKFYYNNAWTAASSYSVTDYDTSYIMFVINVSQTLTTGSSYLLQADNIQISADL